jgi:hypothetical protein
MRHILFVLVACALLLTGTATAQRIPDRATLDNLLGGNKILEDFEKFSIDYGGAANLDVFSLDSKTISNGQGPGLVQPGATYLDPSQVHLQWNGDGYVGLKTKTLLANGGGGGIGITYDAAVIAMGIDLRAFEGYGYQGNIQVYDTKNNVVGSEQFSLSNGGGENYFFGWQYAGGIGRILVSSAAFSWSPVIDNHEYGVPEPTTLILLALGGLAARRR